MNSVFSTTTAISKKEIVLIFIGSLFCLLGIFSNEYMANIFIAPDWSELLPSRVRAALWIINISLIVWGGITIVLRKKAFVVNFNLALISLCIVTPLVGEVFIRSAIYLEIDFFRNPRLYAGWLDDDDHWKLRYQWGKSGEELEGGGFVTDPLLGWAPEKSPQNPLGVLSSEAYEPDFETDTILFYGDSYVYGMSPTPIDQRIPQQLDLLLPDYPVYNYGVVGYGIDQIFLRFRETHKNFEKPFIIVGIYTLDIDRAILTVREAPKPYFEAENTQLILQGVPVSESMEEWLEQYPITIKSFLLAFIVRQYRITRGGAQITEIPYKQAEKKLLATKVIEEIVEEAQSHQLPLLFVVFYPEWEFGYQGWREIFLKDLFAHLEVSYLDTKELFLQRVEHPQEISRFYDHRHAHLNEFGGQLVAETITMYLDQYEGWPDAINK